MSEARRAEQDQFAISLAIAALAVIAVGMLYLAGRPLSTPDLWWHLAMGEVYASEGPWPAGDPMLHTAHEDAPVQHEWLFGVMVHAISLVVGLGGLRILHALTVAGILWLVYRISQRSSGSHVSACFATALFVTLSWWRLSQLRPDVVSIPAALAIYALLIQSDGVPSRRSVAAALGLLVVWANMHSLFAIGLALIGAALMGLALRPALAHHLAAKGESDSTGVTPTSRSSARRLGSTLALGLLLTALNPRGFEQHLTFYVSSRASAIWMIRDEWLAFDPLRWGQYPAGAVSPVAWAATDILLVAFFAVSTLLAIRFWRAPTKPGLRALDPVHFGTGLAGILALLISIRFLWMGIFPLLFLLRALRIEGGVLPSRGAAIERGLCVGALVLALLFYGVTGFSHPSAAAGSYFSRVVHVPDYYTAGVRFLKDSGVEGNLYNEYSLGGYLGYWLSPRLRTFIDSRTEHYPPEVVHDGMAINQQLGRREGETFADILDRRGIDLFFGSGLPTAFEPGQGAKRYATAHLERATDWLLVSRSAQHAIYLRQNARNRANLEHIDAYYAREGVPFDPSRGFEPARVIAARADWAVAHQMIPRDYEQWLKESEARDPARRFAALDRLAAASALTGAYLRAVDFERGALALHPGAESPQRRLVYELLRLDRFEEARVEARRLVERHPDSRRAANFLAAASRYASAREKGRSIWPPEANRPPLDAIINELALFDIEEANYYLAGRYDRVPDPR